jgi:hypothetical protein
MKSHRLGSLPAVLALVAGSASATSALPVGTPPSHAATVAVPPVDTTPVHVAPDNDAGPPIHWVSKDGKGQADLRLHRDGSYDFCLYRVP